MMHSISTVVVLVESNQVKPMGGQVVRVSVPDIFYIRIQPFLLGAAISSCIHPPSYLVEKNSCPEICNEETMAPEGLEAKHRRLIVAEEVVAEEVVAAVMAEANFILQQKQILLYRCMARTLYQRVIIRLEDKHGEA